MDAPPLSDFDPDRVRAATRLSFVEHHATLASTNDRGRQLAAELSSDQVALVVADAQTAGRGRGSNRWWTGAGSLACSLVFDPAARGIRRANFPLISLATAVAIVETARGLKAPEPLGLHWPNDVYAAERKLAGILVEVLPDGMHVIGIGLNVNNRATAAPDELRLRTAALVELTGREHAREDLVVDLLGRLWPIVEQLAESPTAVARAADRACLQHGHKLVIESGDRRAQGQCVGIADDGALLLDTEHGTERFYSGVLLRS